MLSQEAGEIISHTAQQPQPASPVLTVPHNTVPCGPARKLVPQLGQSHRAMDLSLPNLSTAPHFPLLTPAALATFPTLVGAPWAPLSPMFHTARCSFYLWPLTLMPVSKETHSSRTPSTRTSAVFALLLNQFSLEKKKSLNKFCNLQGNICSGKQLMSAAFQR